MAQAYQSSPILCAGYLMPDPTGGTLLLTVKEAAAELRIGKNAAYELIRTGELPCVLVRKSIRVPRADLESYVQSLARPNGASEHRSPGAISEPDA